MSKDFPADWRGYMGFASIWSKSAEWESLDPAARRALSEWVARGGRLILVQDATRGAAEEPYGLGAILSVLRRARTPSREGLPSSRLDLEQRFPA